MVRPVSRRLRICLAHIPPVLGLAVKLPARAVVDLGLLIHPHHPRPSARRSRPARRTAPLRITPRRSAGCPRRGGCPRHVLRRRCRSSRRRRCLSAPTGKPRLHTLVPPAGLPLLLCRRVAPVIAPRRGSGRRCASLGCRCLCPTRNSAQHAGHHQSRCSKTHPHRRSPVVVVRAVSFPRPALFHLRATITPPWPAQRGDPQPRSTAALSSIGETAILRRSHHS